jgi:hypothetical protein
LLAGVTRGVEGTAGGGNAVFAVGVGAGDEGQRSDHPVNKEYSRLQAAAIVGISAQGLRRLREPMEKGGFEGLIDMREAIAAVNASGRGGA